MAKTGTKPSKPTPDFPLTAHPNGKWCKKVRGRLHYFGSWSDPQAALDEWLAQKDYLIAGRKPPTTGKEPTMRELLNQFMVSKCHLMESGELTKRSHDDYNRTCDRLRDHFGLARLLEDVGPEDFEQLRASMAKNWGPVTLSNEINRIRGVFKYAHDAGLLPTPIRFGPGFKRPSKKTLRKARNDRGVRMFEAGEIQQLLELSKLPMRAMILLGCNAGLGNADCAALPISAIDLKQGWLTYPRVKTAIMRRCPLWKETVAALREWEPNRPQPKSPELTDLVFITKYGQRFSSEQTRDCAISKEFKKLTKEAKIDRDGIGFYGLRRSFETIAGDTGDQVATDHIMGHAREDMASVYRERIEDARLKRLTDHVHKWLFPETEKVID